MRDETPLPLSAQLVVHYRWLAVKHAPDPVTKLCYVCGVRRCRDRTFALAQLLAAGESIQAL